MALALECISIIIPISKLEKSREIPDVAQFLREQRVAPGCWFDDHLFRYPGGMNQMDVMLSLDFMKSQGFMLTRKYNGVEHWQDVCVVDAFGGPTMPCRWLEFDAERHIVWCAGREPGEIVRSGSESVLYSKNGYQLE